MKSTGRQINRSKSRYEIPDSGHVLRIGATIGLPDVLEELGEDPHKVITEAQVDPSLFDDPNNLISYTARGELMAYCAKRTSCPHFGLLVGQHGGLLSVGFVGLLAKYSPDVESALHSLVRYLHLHVRGAASVLTRESNLSTFEYQIYHVGAPGNDQVGDGAVAVIFNILAELCGSGFQPIEVRFAHRKPDNVVPYQQFFRAPLRFDTGQYSVVFDTSCLDQPLPYSSPELRLLLQAQIDKIELLQSDDFPEQVRSLLRAVIVTGHSSADQVAELFSMHRRTLNRRLNGAGTTFRELVDEIRFEIARQLLEDSDIDMVQIALILGYSNTSAFTRAFQRWSSTTPALWRLDAR